MNQNELYDKLQVERGTKKRYKTGHGMTIMDDTQSIQMSAKIKYSTNSENFDNTSQCLIKIDSVLQIETPNI